MKRKIISLFILFLFFSNAVAYQVPTHQALSEQAFLKSVLSNNSTFFENIGLSSDPNLNVFPNSLGEEHNVLDLIRFGVGYEDTQTLIRPLNHFYDPQNGGRKLELIALSPIANAFGKNTYPSPDWTLEDLADIPGQNFSYKDATNYFYTALTAPLKTGRDVNWGFMFQSLGHIIHHIQDMAQPQHTRNDPHSPINNRNRQLYESYTEAKRTDPSKGLNYGNYPELNFDIFKTPRSFWDNTDTYNGAGLAEFSSNNFISGGTNFRGGQLSGNNIINVLTHPEFPLPSTNNLQVSARSITGVDLIGVPSSNQVLTGEILFVGTQIVDANTSQTLFNDKTSSFSIFDANLNGVTSQRQFTLNRFTMDAAHDFLIPRAVAYSAGLINYFFRGKISMSRNENGWVIKNESDDEIEGVFELYYDDKDGNRYLVEGAQWGMDDLGISTLPPDTEVLVPDFDAPVEPIRAKPEYTLVFKGHIGQDSTINAVTATQVKPKVIDAIFGNFDTVLHILFEDQSVWSLGLNDEGQLGVGLLQDEETCMVFGFPRQCARQLLQVPLNNVVKIDTQSALKEDGSLYMWGNTRYLADGDIDDYQPCQRYNEIQCAYKPVRILLDNIIDISASLHTLALDANGSVWAWGFNRYGQLGNLSFNSTKVPVRVPSLNDIVQVDTANNTSVALDAEGNVWVWGANVSDRILGHKTYSVWENNFADSDDTIDDFREWQNIMCSGQGTPDSSIRLGHFSCFTSPFKTTLQNISQIQIESASYLAQDHDGNLWSWNGFDSGLYMLGRGENPDIKANIITALNDVAHFGTSSTVSAYAIKSDGSLWGWGQIGLNLGTTYVPINITGINNVVKVVKSREVRLIIKSDGSLWGWGLDRHGLEIFKDVHTGDSLAFTTMPIYILGPKENVN